MKLGQPRAQLASKAGSYCKEKGEESENKKGMRITF